MSVPTIGITGPCGWHHLAWRCSRYALSAAGARTVRLTPEWRGALPPIDGVVLGGGDDLDPALYLGLDDGKGSYDKARDAFEKRVIEDILDRDRPVLGICRGAQLLNVMLGGNLHQDIRHLRVKTSNRRTVLPRKTVELVPNSNLLNIMRTSTARVNSLHHQAIDRPGKDLQVVAHDRDGIVQAVEGTGGSFRVGVQWHPEYLPYRREQRRIFQALVDAARSN